MSVSHTQWLPYISSDPVSNVLLVHGVSVGLISSWAGNVHIPGFNRQIDTEGKLGNLARSPLLISRVSEVKVSQNLIPIRRWRLGEAAVLFMAQLVAYLDTFPPVRVPNRRVTLRTWRPLDLRVSFPLLILLCLWQRVHYLEVGDRQAIIQFISAGARHLVVKHRHRLVVVVQLRAVALLQEVVVRESVHLVEFVLSSTWVLIA